MSGDDEGTPGYDRAILIADIARLRPEKSDDEFLEAVVEAIVARWCDLPSEVLAEMRRRLVDQDATP